MPLIRIQRYAPSALYLVGGTQYLDPGVTLKFNGPTTIVLSEAVYPATGDYILFDYSAAWASFDFSPYASGQVALDTLVAPYVDDSDLGLSGFGSLIDDPIDKKIILRLQSNPTNGCQYIESGVTLDLSNPMQVYLNSALYATPGTYFLFDWSAGGSFVGSVSNITINPPSGLTYVPGSLTVVGGNKIQFTLA